MKKYFFISPNDRCRCASCQIGTTFQSSGELIASDCSFLRKDMDGYRCALTDPKSVEERKLVEKWYEFLREEKGIEVNRGRIPIMFGDRRQIREFEKYLAKEKGSG